MMSEGPAAYYASARESAAFAREVPGLGDEAFAGPVPAGPGAEYVLAMRLGDHAVILASAPDSERGGSPYLRPDQLRAGAKIVLARLSRRGR